MKKYSFAPRIINDWNSLSTNVVMATNTTSLKRCWMFTGMIIDLVFCNFWHYKLCFLLEPLIINKFKNPTDANCFTAIPILFLALLPTTQLVLLCMQFIAIY